MGALPSSLARATWWSVRRATAATTLLGAASIGSAVVSVLGDTLAPGEMTAYQGGAAALVAIVAALPLALPAMKGKRLLIVGALLAITTAAVTYAVEVHDRFGLYLVAAGALGIASGVVSVALMFGAIAARAELQSRSGDGLDAAERAHLFGGAWVAIVWAAAFLLAISRGAPTAVPSIAVVLGLAAVARAALRTARRRRCLQDVAAGRVQGLELVQDTPSLVVPDVPALEGLRPCDSVLFTSTSGGPFRGMGGRRPLARVSSEALSPWPAAATAAVSIVLAVALGGVAAAQTRRTLVVFAWKQKPWCTSWPASSIEQSTRTIAPSTRLAALTLEQPDRPGRLAHLYVVGDAPLPQTDLDALARGLWDMCRWDDRYDARPPLVATNADVVPVDIQIEFRAAPGSPMTREAVEVFQRLIADDVRKSFQPGPGDGRLLGSDCWHYWVLPSHPAGDVFANFRVYDPPHVLFNGQGSCFEGRTDPAFPRLGSVVVSVLPPP